MSRGSGMFRDMIMAAAFGSHPSVASFMVGFRLSHLLRRFFGEGALHTTFVPHFEKIRQEDAERAAFFFRNLTFTLMGFLGLVILFAELCLGSWLYLGQLSGGQREVVTLAGIMLPSLLFVCLFGLHASFLQCERSYFVPGVAPVVFNVVWIGAVALLFHWRAEEAMPYLAFAVLISCLAQWLVTVPLTYRRLSPYLKGRFWKNIQLWSPELKAMLGPLCLGLTGIAAVQVNSALDYLFAQVADPSGPAYLWYAQRIQQAPVGLLGVALSGALLPPLSRAIKQGGEEEFRHFLSFSLCKSAAWGIPLSCGLLVGGLVTLNLVFGRGDFDERALIETTRCLWGYGWGLVPQLLTLVLAPSFYARHDYRTPAWVATGSVAVNVLLNACFVYGLGWGAYAISVATSVSSWVNMLLLVYCLKRQWGLAELFVGAKADLWRCLLASSVAFLLTVFVGFYFLRDPAVLIFWGFSFPEISRSTSQQLVMFFGELFVFFGTFFLLYQNRLKKYL